MSNKNMTNIEILKRREEIKKELQELEKIEKTNKSLEGISSKEYSRLRSLLEDANKGVTKTNKFTVEIEVETTHRYGYEKENGGILVYAKINDMLSFNSLENIFRLKKVSGSLDERSLKTIGKNFVEGYLNTDFAYESISEPSEREMKKLILTKVKNVQKNILSVAKESGINADSLLQYLERYKTLNETKEKGINLE